MTHITAAGLIAAAALAAASPTANGAEEKSAQQPRKVERREMRVLSPASGKNAPREKAAFLGVAASPVSPTLAAQLGLEKDTGLVVNHVVPDSPAASALKQHDILLKLDGQILIDVRQLAVLVRRHKEGDEVSITYVRAGREQTAKLKLTVRELPPLPAPGAGEGMLSPGHRLDILREHLQGGRPFPHVLPHLRDGSTTQGMFRGPQRDPGGIPMDREGGTVRRVTMHPGRSLMILKDEGGTIEVALKDGGRHVLAKDPDGREIFSGSAGTPEELAAMPQSVRERLEKLEKMEGVTIERPGHLDAGVGQELMREIEKSAGEPGPGTSRTPPI